MLDEIQLREQSKEEELLIAGDAKE